MKRVIKLFCKCILVIMPFLAMTVYCMLCPRNYMDSEEAPYYLWNKEVSNTSQDKTYDVVVLGDSSANADYLPELLSDSMINLALGGTTPMENYYTLCDWLAHHEAPHVCYISFREHHLLSEDCFWTRTMFAHRYTLGQNIEMLRAAIRYQELSVLSDIHVLSDSYIWDFLSYQMWLPNKYISPLLNAGFNQRCANNAATWQRAELHGGRYIGMTPIEYTLPDMPAVESFSVNPLFDEYYRKTIELCMENGIQVRIIHLPYLNTFTDGYGELFQEYYNDLKSDYPGLTVDWWEIHSGISFADAAHLNSYGALHFSTELKNLYPEDFGNAPPSAGQIAGINDYIAQEIELDHIFDWIAGRGYTVLLYDAQGLIQPLYGELIDTDVSDIPLAVTPLGVGQAPEEDSIYAVVDDGQNVDAAVFQAEDGTLMVQTNGGGPVAWAIVPGAVLGVFVIDSFGRTVCAKSFSCTEGTQITLLG